MNRFNFQWEKIDDSAMVSAGLILVVFIVYLHQGLIPAFNAAVFSYDNAQIAYPIANLPAIYGFYLIVTSVILFAVMTRGPEFLSQKAALHHKDWPTLDSVFILDLILLVIHK